LISGEIVQSIMAGTTKKATRTGTVEIKKCGFNTRPKLMVPGPAGDEDATVDVLPDLFSGLEGKEVRVTVELAGSSEKGPGRARKKK
jgi:hypothetical protein